MGIASASGASLEGHSGFSSRAANRNMNADIAMKPQAKRRVRSPAGRWRDLVLGLAASISASSTRLKAIATLRAATMAITIHRGVLGGSASREKRSSRHASSAPVESEREREHGVLELDHVESQADAAEEFQHRFVCTAHNGNRAAACASPFSTAHNGMSAAFKARDHFHYRAHRHEQPVQKRVRQLPFVLLNAQILYRLLIGASKLGWVGYPLDRPARGLRRKGVHYGGTLTRPSVTLRNGTKLRSLAQDHAGRHRPHARVDVSRFLCAPTGCWFFYPANAQLPAL